MCYCDADTPSVYNTEVRKAQKVHIWDGDPATYKTCSDCLDLRKWAEAHVKCICWAHGEVHEIIRDTLHAYESECPGITVEAIGKMSAIRRKRREPAFA